MDDRSGLIQAGSSAHIVPRGFEDRKRSNAEILIQFEFHAVFSIGTLTNRSLAISAP